MNISVLVSILVFLSGVRMTGAKCQYTPHSKAPGPEHIEMLCSAENAKINSNCVHIAMVPARKNLSMVDCEKACSVKGPSCKGYVVRTPWDFSGEAADNCWLLKPSAFNEHGGLNIQWTLRAQHKVTYEKRYCDCETRYVHVRRLPRAPKVAAQAKIEKVTQNIAEVNDKIKSAEASLNGRQESTTEKPNEVPTDRLFPLKLKLRKLQQHLRPLQTALPTDVSTTPLPDNVNNNLGFPFKVKLPKLQQILPALQTALPTEESTTPLPDKVRNHRGFPVKVKHPKLKPGKVTSHRPFSLIAERRKKKQALQTETSTTTIQPNASTTPTSHKDFVSRRVYKTIAKHRPEAAAAGIRTAEGKLSEYKRRAASLDEALSKANRTLQAENAKLRKAAPVEELADIYQWLPAPADKQDEMKLRRIRIYDTYLSDDKTKVLYKCQMFGKRHAGQADWYIATMDEVLSALGAKSIATVSELSPLHLAKLYFSLSCVGARVSAALRSQAESQVCIGSGSGECLAVPTLSKNDDQLGCHEDVTSASARRESLTIADMEGEKIDGRPYGCPIQNNEDSLEVIEWARWVLGNPNLLKNAVSACQFGRMVGIRYCDRMQHLSRSGVDTMMKRAKDLIEHVHSSVGAIATIHNTTDFPEKVACSKLLLKSIQGMEGIFPKLAQNLAMRPDLVSDAYAREKLKETQTDNKQLSKEEVESYVGSEWTTLTIKGKEREIFQHIEFDELLAAGSVGQVLRYKVTSQELAQELAESGANTKLVILKVVFKETERLYREDWQLLDTIFNIGGRKIPALLQALWEFLRPMEKSIFDEFDLRVEGSHTMNGRSDLAEFSSMIEDGRIEGISNVLFTTPLALTTSSQYTLVQSLAPGVALKEYMVEAVGQPVALAVWREKIYRGILHLYGYMALGKGYFQADPHGGNWFIDVAQEPMVVTLIDWGGVEVFSNRDRCQLASIYSRGKRLADRWDDCTAMKLELGSSLSHVAPELPGIYNRAGVSVFPADEEHGIESVFMGRSVAIRYSKKGPHGREHILRFDGHSWRLAELCLNVSCPQLYADILTVDVPSQGKAWFDFLFDAKKSFDPRDPVAAGKAIVGNDRAWPTWKVVDPKLSNKKGMPRSKKIRAKISYANEQCPSAERLTSMDNVPQMVDAYAELGKYIGLEPDRGSVKDEVLATATAALDSDVERIARAGLEVHKLLQHHKEELEREGRKYKDMPGLIPKVLPQLALLGRCLAVFQGMLGEALAANIPPKLSEEYLEWFVDDSKDRLFSFWARYAWGIVIEKDTDACLLASEENRSVDAPPPLGGRR